MFFIAYTFKGHVHVFAGQVKIEVTVLQDKCNIEIILSPDRYTIFNQINPHAFYLFENNNQLLISSPSSGAFHGSHRLE